MKKEKMTGTVVPLGALYTKENAVIGEFPDLVPFAEFCKASGLSIIQLLPVNDTGTQSSPYSGLSAFALHPIYIRIKDVPSFETLYKDNEKFKKEYDSFIEKNPYVLRYKYDSVLTGKIRLLQLIYEQSDICKNGKPTEELSKWIKANGWVKTYAVYKNMKLHYQQASWKTWIENDRTKSKEEILELWNTKAFEKEHLFFAWVQMIAAGQFKAAVDEVHKMGILIKGDMPILMNEDSCDAWAYPQFFNQNLRAGSPADGDNPSGQNWGFPTYNWKNLKAENYSWWKDRLKFAEKYYDAYRLDHILGFYRIWAIPSGDCNALNGHTEPYAFIKRDELYEAAFDDNRIRWLSQPHIPTGVVEDITWNHDVAVKILSLLCDRVGNEELWLFKKTVEGSQQIWDTSFNDICNQDAAFRIKEKLVKYWSDRTLIEIAKNKFIPLWTYSKSTSWGTLNENEKASLQKMFESLDEKNNKLWKKQADEIFAAITAGLKMVPCGEDLGVNIPCVPEVMKKNNILGLRVIRWCRNWGAEGQPYEDFDAYEPLSVATTSVHDSTTVRQWWQDEKQSVKAFIQANPDFKASENDEFSPEIAQSYMKTCAKAKSIWYISPLQDFLYMKKKYWLKESADERINIPGTVTEFNWTYRLPCTVEDLLGDNELIKKIRDIKR